MINGLHLRVDQMNTCDGLEVTSFLQVMIPADYHKAVADIPEDVRTSNQTVSTTLTSGFPRVV